MAVSTLVRTTGTLRPCPPQSISVRPGASCCHQWLAAGPLDRLKILPPGVEETSAGMVRLDQRVTMMLMNAVPESIRHEIVATRQLHASRVLYKVLRTYQPGGQSERALTLSAITQTQPAEDPSQATEALRLWRRQVLRALELQALLPDPSGQGARHDCRADSGGGSAGAVQSIGISPSARHRREADGGECRSSLRHAPGGGRSDGVRPCFR